MSGPLAADAEDPGALAASLLERLVSLADPGNVAGMARYGISSVGTLGVPVSTLRGIDRELRPLRGARPEVVHEVASALWTSGVHEARILAGIIDVPALVTPRQADAWVADLDSWDTCDQLQKLFAATPFAYGKAGEWAAADPEFTRRAGLVLMATLAVHDKLAPDERLVEFLPLVAAGAPDGRNAVKKAASWALRQIGKRSATCHGAAVHAGEEILVRYPDSASARWVARDALRELRSEAVLARVGRAAPTL